MDNSSFTPYVYSPPTAPTASAPVQQPAQQSGNWFSKILPTAGSILGGIGGTLLDPILGPLGTIGGSAVGDALGKGVENGVEGKGFNLGDEGTALGEGAAGGLLGGIGGKVLGGLASKGADIAGNTVPKLLQGQVADGTLDDETAQHLANNGITSMSQMAQIHPLVTGETGALNGGVNDTLNEAAKNGMSLDLSSLERQGALPGKTVGDAITNAGITQGSNQAKAVDEFIQGKLQKAVGPEGMSTVAGKGNSNVQLFNNGVTHTINPNAALQLSKDLYSQASKWASSSSDGAIEKASALRDVASTINNGLYGEGSTIGQAGVPDAIKQQMIDQLAPLKQINPQYYQSKVDAINTPNLTVAQLRSAQLPDVKAAQALDTTANLNNGKGINIGNAVPGSVTPHGVASHGINKLLQSGAVNKGGASLLSKMQPILQKIGDSKGIQNGVGLTAADTITNAGNLQPNAITPTAQGDTTQVQPGTSPLQTSYQIAQNDAINPYLTGSALPSLTTLTGDVQQGRTGQAALSALEQAYAQAGGGQGFLGGTLAKLGGALTGNNVSAYSAQEQQALKVLSALGIPASALPQVTNTNGAANSQFQNIQSILNSINGLPVAQGS